MAVRDYQNDIQSILNGNDLTIQPAVGDQWELHTIEHGEACDVKITDGANTITVDSYNDSGTIEGLKWELDNDHYVLVTNTSGGSALFGYQGVQTK